MRHSVGPKSGMTVPSGARMPPWSRMFSGCLLVLLLLASPGIRAGGEDSAPQNFVPTVAEERLALELPAGDGPQKDGEAEAKKPQKKLLAIPFPFYNATIGPGVGVGFIAQGYLQPQAITVGAALMGAGSYSIFIKELNYQLPWWKRVILEPDVYIGKYEQIKSFSGSTNTNFVGQRAGSNESSSENYRRSDATDQWVNLVTKFLLPIGQGKDNVFPKLVLDRGLFVSGDTGGDVWNPFTSGRTYLEVVPFERRQGLVDNYPQIQDRRDRCRAPVRKHGFSGKPHEGKHAAGLVHQGLGGAGQHGPLVRVRGRIREIFFHRPQRPGAAADVRPGHLDGQLPDLGRQFDVERRAEYVPPPPCL